VRAVSAPRPRAGVAAAALLLAMLLAGCAAGPAPGTPGAAPADAADAADPAAAAAAGDGTTDDGSAPPAAAPATRFEPGLVTPLHDLNLVRAEIPALLLAARRAPYARPADLSCAALAAEVAALDALLGVDLDTPAASPDDALVERGADLLVDTVHGALQGALAGLVPFRRWVRQLTGAERYAREVAAAIVAGSVRRAYLKGLGDAGGCAPPAAPRR
jgi:hypothetical protein